MGCFQVGLSLSLIILFYITDMLQELPCFHTIENNNKVKDFTETFWQVALISGSFKFMVNCSKPSNKRIPAFWGQGVGRASARRKSPGSVLLFQRAELNAALHRIVSIHSCHSGEDRRATQEYLGADHSVVTQ